MFNTLAVAKQCRDDGGESDLVVCMCVCLINRFKQHPSCTIGHIREEFWILDCNLFFGKGRDAIQKRMGRRMRYRKGGD